MGAAVALKLAIFSKENNILCSCELLSNPKSMGAVVIGEVVNF